MFFSQLEQGGIKMEKNKNFLTEEENIKINIVTENDEELSCEVVGIYEAGEYEYIALVPDNSDELYLYRYEEGEDGLKLDSIEDLDEMKLAEEVFWDVFGTDEEDFDEKHHHCGCGCGCDHEH